MAVQSYRELIVWQRAMDLVVEAYKCTKMFPREEIYALTNQLRRAAVSVPSNIAEGQGRGAGAEFRHHFRISQGSLQEMETQMLLAVRLGYVKPRDIAPTFVARGGSGKVESKTARFNPELTNQQLPTNN